MPNIILALLNISWRRKKIFLVDGIVRGKPSTPDVIVALLKARKARKTQHDFSAIDKKTMMPAGQNRQGRQVILHIILTLFKVMIPGGWNSHRVANNTQHHPSHGRDAIEVGLNRQTKASNNQ